MDRSLIPERLSFSRDRLEVGSLSGISTRFRVLFPSPGQISYVLRTRSPLSTTRRWLPVRLACVRHAASVHPEPGSNSPYVEVELLNKNRAAALFDVACCVVADLLD